MKNKFIHIDYWNGSAYYFTFRILLFRVSFLYRSPHQRLYSTDEIFAVNFAVYPFSFFKKLNPVP